MSKSTDLASALELASAETANRFPSIFLPNKIYEALPAAYILIGTLFILGVAYIGIDHGLMGGYLAVGLSCILAGVSVNTIRRKERSRSANALA